MGKVYVGLAFSASMLPPGHVRMVKDDLSIDEVRKVIEAGAISCANPAHRATLNALRAKYGIEISIPDRPPRVALERGDSIVVLQVGGLPRLVDRHEYTPEEIESATFSFMEIMVD